MIVDSFIFSNELGMLELRLEILADTVDRFVLVEADRTFSGNPKPLVFEENKDRFDKFLDRIEHIVVDDMPNNPNPWVKEIHQRNAVRRGFGGLRDNDIVMVSDVDEIPDVERIEAQIPNEDIHALTQAFYYYYFNLRKACGARPMWACSRTGQFRLRKQDN